MPTWGELLKERAEIQRKLEIAAQVTPPEPGAPSPFDILRRKYLRRLHEYTGRAVIVYASAFLEEKDGVSANALSIGLGDQMGFMEAVSNIEERELDLILHSPGGSAEAAEAIINYLRTRFDHIRVVVPVAAMSAATMMALAADEIVMGDHSQLGPIDPQFTIHTPEGPRSAPGQAIIDQFTLAKAECADPSNIAAWLPIIRGYGPGLLAQCQHQRQLAEEFASRNLQQFMFRDDPDGDRKAVEAARWFADFAEFRSHGRRVSREDALGQGLKVTPLEEDDDLQDRVLSVSHAFNHTLAGTAAAKIIENHHGRAWIQQIQQIQIQQVVGPPNPSISPVPTPASTPTGVRGANRAERRRQERKQEAK